MRIIKKSDLIIENAVPNQLRNAVYFLSQRSLSNISYVPDSNIIVWHAESQAITDGKHNTVLVNFRLSRFMMHITVSDTRWDRNGFPQGNMGRLLKAGPDYEYGQMPWSENPSLPSAGNFMLGSAGKLSVSVNHNLSWFHHGFEKAYFSGMPNERSQSGQ